MNHRQLDIVVDSKSAGLIECPICKKHSVDEKGYCYNGCSGKLTEQGNCFETTGNLMNDMDDSAILCHGMVTGQGKVKGIRFAHAWIELRGSVLELSNGNNVCIPIEKYYRIGKIDSDKVKRYSKKEALINMLKFKNYGSWEALE